MAPLVLNAMFVFTLTTILLSNHGVATEASPPITLTYHVFEEIPEGTPIGNLKEDAGFKERYSLNELSFIRFRFLMQPPAPVELETTTGSLVTNGRLDREQYCENEVTCELSIDIAVQPIQYFQIVKITLVIEDLNDNAPEFEETSISFQIPETTAVGKALVLPEAFDMDSPSYGIRSYELSGTRDKFVLQIDQKGDGSAALKLLIKDALDREEHADYNIKLEATDFGDLVGTTDIHVHVLDANDNNPQFYNTTYDVTVTENVAVGSTIVRVEAFDPDEGANGEITYSFSQRTKERFGHIIELDSKTGDILVRDVLDYEEYDVLHIAVIAEDGGSNTLPAECLIIVTVIDLNDNSPNVTINTLTGSDIAEVSEDSPVGTFVAHFSVIDKDSGENGIFDCFLRHNNFGLSKLYDTEYQVVTKTTLDRETKAKYDVTIECIDEGTPHLATFTFLSIVVTDFNDNAPEFDQFFYEVIIQENNAVGKSLLQVSATDADEGVNAEITFSVADNAKSLFSINPQSGHIFASISYDREKYKSGSIEFTVIAMDNGSPALSSSVTVSVTLLDVNDEAPHFLQDGYSFGVFENEVAPVLVGQVAALDKDQPPFNQIQYSIEASSLVHHHFTIDPHTGVIQTTQSLDREEVPMYVLTIHARDSESLHLRSSTSVTVYVSDKNDNDPVFEFPNVYNFSVKLPSNAPDHYAVTRIRAKDPDLGENAQVRYFITSGDDKHWFKLDEQYGILTTSEKFEKPELETIKLLLLVSDRGETPRNTTAFLNIHIVAPVAALNAQTTDNNDTILSSTNLTIVISLAVISIAITIILVVAIILIYKRTKAKKAQQYGQYNCRKEALRMWQHNGTTRSDEHTLTHEMYAMNGSSMLSTGSGTMTSHGNACGTVTSKKEVSFNLDAECDPESQQSMRSTIDSHALRNPRAQSSTLNVTAVTSQSTLPGSNHPALTSRQAEQRQLEVERLMDMLRRQEYETNSVISEEDSTTDSGRGPSEEGDHAHRHLSNDSVNRFKSTYLKTRTLAKESPDPQVVPSISNQTTPNSNQPKSLSLLPTHIANRGDNYGIGLYDRKGGIRPETVCNELAKLENGRGGRLASDSCESVHSDCELLNETDRKAAVNPQMEHAFVQTATPASTPTAIWRKNDYTPSNFYASYLDYKYPKSSQLTLTKENNLTDSVLQSPGGRSSPTKTTAPRKSSSPPKSTGRPEMTTFLPQNVPHNRHRSASPQKSPHSQYQRLSPQKHLAKSPCSSLHDKPQKSILVHKPPCIKDISPVKKVTSPVQTNELQSSRKKSPEKRLNVSISSPMPKLYDDTMEQTDNGLLYSCADMTGVSALKTPNTLNLASGNDVMNLSDNGSSTSGSYVVDPQDLCDKIDEIFFKESEA